jgi:hypothetical protein
MWRELIAAMRNPQETADARHCRRWHRDATRATTCREPTLTDLLADPIVEALMRADGVNAYEVATMISRVNGDRSAERLAEVE